jgi:hypothetical protein
VPGSKSDTIDFGMRFESEEVLIKKFIFENNSSATYYVGETAPTFATLTGPSGNESHGAFEEPDNRPPVITINPLGAYTEVIEFRPFNFSADRTNLYDAYFRFGISRNRTQLGNPDFIDFEKEFILIGRTSNKLFDIWENKLSLDSNFRKVKFDSVLINSPISSTRQINFRNNSESLQISLDSVNLEFVTSQPALKELSIEELNLPIDLQPRSQDPGSDQESVEIYYRPSTRGLDTANLHFYASADSYFEKSSATITGIGVDQELSIINSDVNFFIEDNLFVLDLGNIPNGKQIVINGTLINSGNINFHCINNNIESNDLIGQINFNNSKTFTLDLDETVDYSATITPINRGRIEGEILIESDINSRNIGSYVEAIHRFEKIKIRANSIEPDIAISVIDTLDFGLISGTGDCADESIKEIIIKNTGTGDLEIINAFTTNPIIFDVDLDTNSLSSNGETILRISFEPSGNNIFRLYDKDKLILVTNIRAPKDTIFIPLKANFVQPGQTRLFAENTSFFPGTRINLPVIVDGEQIVLSDRFSSTLTFDPSLLRLNQINTLGTSSESAANTSFFSEINPGELSININIPLGENFKNKDTLCLLEFDTYLGKKIETPLVFSGSKFGDSDCQNLVLVNPSVGIVGIDSLCNVDQLVRDWNQINVSDIYPNPTDNLLKFEITTELESKIELKIINQYGRLKLDKTLFIDSKRLIELDITSYQIGLYFLQIEHNNSIINRTFIKN